MGIDEATDATGLPGEIGWPDDVGAPWSEVPRTTLLEFLVPLLTRGGERPAVIFDDGVALSCTELLRQAERLAGRLAGLLVPGDRVALAVGNRAEFLIAYLAILANRSVVVSLNPSIQSHDAAYVLGDSGAVLAIAETEPAAVLREAGSATLREILVVGDEEPAGLAGAGLDAPPIGLQSVDASVQELTDIGYTSGTTGLPKALPGDHLELLRYTDIFLRTSRFGPGDRILCPLQFHYGDPLWLLFASLTVGEPLIVMRRFSVSRFWQVAKRFEATRIMTIGAIPNLLLTAPPSPSDRDHRVELAIAVAVPRNHHAELVRRFGFPWLEFYGSSESGPAISLPEQWAERYVGTGALGIPVPEVQARLVDGDGHVTDGFGELELSGMVLFEGYLDAPQATAEVLRDGWLRTGDLMQRDQDGVYYFAGRRKELIRRGGENIAPVEVEETLRLHPAVIDAAVVPVEDGLRGEEVKAYVQLVAERAVRPQELVDFCAARLAAFKVPRFIELRAEPFPRTPSQRIPKARLMIDGVHQTTTAWDREEGR